LVANAKFSIGSGSGTLPRDLVIQQNLTTLQDVTNTVSYSPVLMGRESFLDLYLMVQHSSRITVSNLTSQLRIFSIVVVAAIGITAVVVAVIVVS